MDYSLPGSSVHGISKAKYTRVGCYFLLPGIFPNPGSNSCLLHQQVDSLPLSKLLELKKKKQTKKPTGERLPALIPSSGRRPRPRPAGLPGHSAGGWPRGTPAWCQGSGWATGWRWWAQFLPVSWWTALKGEGCQSGSLFGDEKY